MSEEKIDTENTKSEKRSKEKPVKKEAPKSKRECPSESSADGKHSFFFNEGTEETYCRFCGCPK